MKHIMFDVDGTLIKSFEFDEVCYVNAVQQVTGLAIDSNWASYPDITDRGILITFIERQAPHYELATLEPEVKAQFTHNIRNYLDKNPVQETSGAKKFFSHLRSSDRFAVSIATGGWAETARLKLKSAGFDISGIKLVSSNDHHQRAEIMKLAGTAHKSRLTYFGDAQWDINACKELGVNLVIVGERVSYEQSIDNFENINLALRYT